MLSVVICVGSSCHVRGSDAVAATFERLIAERGLSDQVELVGAFCMDACSMGVSVRVQDTLFHNVSALDAEKFLDKGE